MYLMPITEENKDFIARHFNYGVTPPVEGDHGQPYFFLVSEDGAHRRIVDAETYLNYTAGSMGTDPKSIVIEHV